MQGLVTRAGIGRAVRGRRSAALALLAALAVQVGPARAAEGGFFGFLSAAFGIGNAPAPSAAPPAAGEGEPARPLTVRRAPRKAAQSGVGRARVTRGPTRTGPVSIFEDATLRNGDAVMTKDGMKVFAGGRFSPDHPYGDADFIAVSASKSVSPEMKKTVIEINKLPHG